MDDSPIWLIYDAPDGDGIEWLRVPGHVAEEDIVTARHSTGGHTGPDWVLAWIHGQPPTDGYLSADIGDDAEAVETLDILGSKIWRAQPS